MKMEEDSKRDIDMKHGALLIETNELLSRVGIAGKKVSSIAELSRVSSSMFVAVYESLFHTRLEGIIRKPQYRDEYTSNAQTVIDELSEQIQIDLKHIRGEDIASGDIRSISNLLHIFARIFNVTSVDGHHQELEGNDDDRFGSDSLSTHESTFQQPIVPRQTVQMKDVSLVDGVSDSHDILHKDETTDPEKVLVAFRDTDIKTSRERAPLVFRDPDSITISSIAPSEELKKLINAKQKNAIVYAKVDAARKRRMSHQMINNQIRLVQSSAKEEKTFRLKQERWTSEQLREEQAARIRARSQQHVMLKKVYVGLVRDQRFAEVEHAQFLRERQSKMKDSLSNKIQSMEVVLQECQERMKARERQRDVELAQSEQLHRRAMQEVKLSLLDKFQKQREEHRLRRDQQWDREWLTRSESFACMLDMMKASAWEDTLRASYPPGKGLAYGKTPLFGEPLGQRQGSHTPPPGKSGLSTTGRHGFKVSPIKRSKSAWA